MDAGIHIKWVRPESIHLTLQFLGDVDQGVIPSIQRGIEKAVIGVPPFSLKVKGVGVFPNSKRPRILWMGLTGDTDELINLKTKISNELESIGFPIENRPFKGHLTIGRVKDRIDSRKLYNIIPAQNEYETPFFDVTSVCLFKSRLTPQGAIYSKLANVTIVKDVEMKKSGGTYEQSR